MKSILLDESQPQCYFTGRTDSLERHHIFRGANRKKSEKFGLVVYLIKQLHDPACKGSVHNEPQGELNMTLLRAGQQAFERTHGTREDFMRHFGRNWL